MAATKDLVVEKRDDATESATHRKQVEFINIAAHEMKAPLQTILTSSELLKRDPSSGQKYAPVIIRNAKRLQAVAKNLLDLSRIENQSVRLSREIFNLTEVITDTIDDVIPSFAKSYQNLRIIKPDRNVFVYADKDRISQVISNLLTNAIKFTTSGTISITIEKKSRQKQAIVTVKDDGLGINPTIMQSLFSKFVSTSPQGLGLGLYITKNIIEAHGGHITAHNNRDGNGASFIFTLPL
ncbi:sensor histidine kinase [Candidatus Nitrosotenuis cloacae]|uniref:sensor histidine kinase n=1 Tax=Candidatus Nitrosotenuis cloacae TaxID=1603555 RepID=UPI00227E6C03|nr:HAMP domain-containing sensor histidine kinase [Candidatus Nitrosotenuis cloacae]